MESVGLSVVVLVGLFVVSLVDLVEQFSVWLPVVGLEEEVENLAQGDLEAVEEEEDSFLTPQLQIA